MPLPLFESEPTSPSSSDSSSTSAAAFGSPVNKNTLKSRAINVLQDFNYAHFAFKTLAYSWLVLMLLIAWKDNSYFNTFHGGTACGLNAMNLYIPPRKLQDGPLSRDMFCRSRTKLLEAMGGGGRVGFDAAYVPAGCHYRWYNVEEICMILERFDGLLFVGDETLKDVYAGFNILLREDLSLGAMKQWEMNDDNMKTCKCEQQFINEGCAKFRVDASEQVTTNIGSTKNPSMASFTCQRTSHAFLAIDAFPISAPTIDAFNKLVPKAPQSHYKHIPILYSLTSPHSTSAATKNMDELILYADATKRKTPMLWVGPTAAGHLDGKAGHQDIWRFSAEMVQAAHDRDVESLSLWNMTVQASSYDGKGFSEGVAITQAMMIVNWLSRLETS